MIKICSYIKMRFPLCWWLKLAETCSKIHYINYNCVCYYCAISCNDVNWSVSLRLQYRVTALRTNCWQLLTVLQNTNFATSSSRIYLQRHNICCLYSGTLWKHYSCCKQNRTALCCVITQRVVVTPYRRFGTTYWSHLQRSILWRQER